MVAGYSLFHLLILLIVLAAAIAITVIILRQMGVAIPPWVIQIFWILALVFVALIALRFLFSMAGGL